MSVDRLLSKKTTVKLIKMEKNDANVLAYTSEPVSLISFYGKSLPKKVPRQPQIKVIDEIPSPGTASDSDDSIFQQKLSLRKSSRKIRPVLGSNNTTHNVKKVKKTTQRPKRNKRTNSTSAEQKKDHDEEDFFKTSDIEEIPELNRKRPVRTAFSRAAKQISSYADKCEMQKSDDARKPPLKGTRDGSQRKAALEVAKKMAKTDDFLRSLDKELSIMKRDVYVDSDSEEYSTSEDEDSSISSEENKNIKKKENQNPLPSPKFCEYEKAAQDKVALRMQFLKSLDIFSEI